MQNDLVEQEKKARKEEELKRWRDIQLERKEEESRKVDEQRQELSTREEEKVEWGIAITR
jgi:hypothetical protein